MSNETLSILDGNTFVVSDRRGDIDAHGADPTGLFSWDTRFLSRWVLTIDGQGLSVLSADDTRYFQAQFFLATGTGTVYVDSGVSIIRQRAVGDGFHEDLTVMNHSEDAVDLAIRIDADADFADLFEVKDALNKKGFYYRRVEGSRLVLGYHRESFTRETWISADEALVDENGLAFRAHIESGEQWAVCINVVTARRGTALIDKTKYAHGVTRAQPNMECSLEQWLADAPRLESDRDWLKTVYRRSLIDLAALRFSPRSLPGHSLPAAGLPWFMTIFGRDSIITSLQALPFVPALAKATLLVLAQRQGARSDDFREEDPGKILHEMRFGEMTAFEERPHSPYFGSADATPLFLVLLDEYERWTGDEQLVRNLEPEARAALRWLDAYGDRDGDGYIEYRRRNEETGLENQCWKDSWDSIAFRNGTLAALPRATCEIQGYAYDARVRSARLARRFWSDHALADRLEGDAAALKERFNRDFWIENRQFFALALDGEGRRVDSLTSNIGHLLWSGIADDAKAKACAKHLMASKLYSGWGVRTMAEGEGRYNPIGYHVGTVWPHDNAISAWGLRRYGFGEEAARIAAGMLDAARFFGDRLPEAFAGFPRTMTRFPAEYPTACSPQAWAAGAPLLLLRTMLGLEPHGEHLIVEPVLPVGIGRLELLGVPGRWGHRDAFARGAPDETRELSSIRQELGLLEDDDIPPH